jgi:hypothetical protein
MELITFIAQLRHEGEIFDEWFTDNDGNDYFPGETMMNAADVIERMKKAIDELLPYMQKEVEHGISLGAPPDGHLNDECLDCQWYTESLTLKGRLDAGEFDFTNIYFTQNTEGETGGG